MSRLDDLGEILDSYEGRENQEEKKLAVKEVDRAMQCISERLGVRDQVEKLDYEAKEAIAKAFYACLSIHKDNSLRHNALVNIVDDFFQDIGLYLYNSPELETRPGPQVTSKYVKQFAEHYIEYLEEIV